MINIFITSLIKGIPLFSSVIDLFKPKTISVPTRDINGNLTTPQVIAVNNRPIYQKVIMVCIESTSVYGFIYLMKRLGLTYEDIINLFGLIK